MCYSICMANPLEGIRQSVAERDSLLREAERQGAEQQEIRQETQQEQTSRRDWRHKLLEIGIEAVAPANAILNDYGVGLDNPIRIPAHMADAFSNISLFTPIAPAGAAYKVVGTVLRPATKAARVLGTKVSQAMAERAARANRTAMLRDVPTLKKNVNIMRNEVLPDYYKNIASNNRALAEMSEEVVRSNPQKKANLLNSNARMEADMNGLYSSIAEKERAIQMAETAARKATARPSRSLYRGTAIPAALIARPLLNENVSEPLENTVVGDFGRKIISIFPESIYDW